MADQQLPHFTIRTEPGNWSLGYSSLWDWSCLFEHSVSPMPQGCGSPCSWHSFSSHPSEMAGRKPKGGCVRGNSPRAAAAHNSSSCLPFFSFRQGGRDDGEHFFSISLRCKSEAKNAKGRFKPLEEQFGKLKAWEWKPKSHMSYYLLSKEQ